ncbi:MAG: hypothetical protein EOM20_16680 [Spartobacteria bacterium]|nr:hypothetical protein [Spartobacteria bacterium]
MGKTTLLKHEYSAWDYVVFDPYQDAQAASMPLENHTRNFQIADGLVVAPVDSPRWITEDVLCVPWNWSVA